MLASQHVTQMPDRVKESAFANSGVLVSFNVDLDDAKLFAARMEHITTDDITRQQRGECLARIDTEPFFVKTSLPKVPEQDCTEYVVSKMHQLNQLVVPRTPEAARTKPKRATMWAPANDVIEVCEGVK